MQTKLINFIKLDLVGDPSLELNEEDDLLSGGLISSMGFFRLVNFIEEQFGIKVPSEDLTIDNFISVEAMVAYLAEAKEAANE